MLFVFNPLFLAEIPLAIRVTVAEVEAESEMVKAPAATTGAVGAAQVMGMGAARVLVHTEVVLGLMETEDANTFPRRIVDHNKLCPF